MHTYGVSIPLPVGRQGLEINVRQESGLLGSMRKTLTIRGTHDEVQRFLQDLHDHCQEALVKLEEGEL